MRICFRVYSKLQVHVSVFGLSAREEYSGDGQVVHNIAIHSHICIDSFHEKESQLLEFTLSEPSYLIFT